MHNFTGKTALITGASGDIGAACARILHKNGAFVIISGTNQEKLESLAQELQNNVKISCCDLNNIDDCQRLIQDVEKLDILICNAGITKDGLAMRMSNQNFTDVINVNLNANFILNREAIKIMMKNRFGRIINISSVIGATGNAGQANYAASKAGLIGMTKSLAAETASRNITVNSIAPGFITTNMTSKLSEEQKQGIMQKIPMRRFGTPEDVAQAASFLASDDASYITGHTLHVNGGMYMA